MEFTEASAIVGDGAAELEKQLAETPGVTSYPHPESKRRLFELVRGRFLLNDSGDLRLERTRVEAGKGWPAVIKPRHIRLWSANEWTQFTIGGGDEAEVRTLRLPSRADRLDIQKRGGLAPDLQRGMNAFPCLARWATTVLSQSKDLKIVAENGETVTVETTEFGMTVTVDSASGELKQLRYASGAGLIWEWRWEGALPGAWFPARFPKTEFHYFSSPDEPRTPGNLVTYTSVTPIENPGASTIEWRSVAPHAFKVYENVVIDSSGLTNEERTRRRQQHGAPTGDDLDRRARPQRGAARSPLITALAA